MRPLAGFLLVVCALFWAGPTSAQTTSAPSTQTRPYRGLFGGGSGNTDQSLALTLSFIGGYDTSVQTAGTPSSGDATGAALGSAVQSVRTGFEQATAGLGYSLTHDRVSLSASVMANGTYYQTLAKTIVSSTGSVGGAFTISSRTNVSATETVAYQPLFFSNTFPTIGGNGIGQPIIPDTTTGARLDNYESQTSALNLSHKFSQRVDVSVGYQRAESTFSHEDDTLTQSVAGRINFNVTRYLSLWVGDSYFDSEGRSAGIVTESQGQLVNFGLGYNRLASISLSRHLRLALGAGLTAVSDGQSEQLALTGNATLTYEIGRSWTAAASYRRDVGFVAFFDLPVTTDGAIAQINGLIARRIMFQASAGASTSTVGFHGPSNGYATQYASANLSYGLTRTLALGLGYSDYRYQFDSGLQLPVGVLKRTNGQTVYAFLNIWQPLFATKRGR